MNRFIIVAAVVLGFLPWSAFAGTENAGPMALPRYQHVRVALTDGRALIAGGVTNSGFTAAAELYDPVTSTFSAAAPMSIQRASPAGLRLADGRILVAGGSSVGPNGTYGETSAEIYDPATNTWSATGSMSTGRRAPFAALLPDGRVLVVGGELNVMSAEVYDPATGTFSPTASYALQRYDQAMTVLGDGRVLLVGGMLTSGSATPAAEIWDPATGTWSFTGSMNFARYRHTATLLSDGRVLIAGGNNVAAAEIFDPSTGTFSTTGGLVTPRYSHSAAVMGDGNVIITGGINISATTIATLERYDVAAGTWRAAGSMVGARRNVGTTLLADGDVLLSGGITATTQATTAVELVDPVCNVVPASLSPTTLPFGISGGPGSVTVTHAEGCRWRVTGQIYAWITGNPLFGMGNGTVPFTVAANTGTSTRTASFTIADATFQVTQAGNPCASATLSPASQSFVSAGGNGTATLGVGATCAWTVSGVPSWITIAASGTGGGAIPYSVVANPGSARNATLTIAGRTLAITQSANPCSPAPTISPASRSVGQFATSTSVAVTANAACSWTVTGVPSWAHTLQSGIGSRSFSISVDSNPTTSPRSASFTIAGQAFVLTQAANFCATSTASPSSQTVGNGGGTASVTVTALPECAWSLSGTIPSWITLTSATTGSGDAVLTMSIAPNVTNPARSASFYVGYGSFEIKQAAGSCYPAETIAPTVDSASATGGSRSVQVTANPGCPWAVTQVPPWITLTSPASGSGSSTVTYDIAPNVSYARNGTLLIGARSLAVSQGAPGLATLPGPALNEARAGHGIATLDDRRILVAGGHSNEANASASALASVEIYDQATGVFSLVAPMARPRTQHVTAKVGLGRVLVAGGSNAEGGGSNTLADAELFDPNTGAWTPTGSLPVARAEASWVQLWDGRVLVVGGRNGTTSLDDSVLYDPATGTWTPSGNVVQPRVNGALALTGPGTVLYAGGYSPTTGEYLASAETWDSATGVWTATGSMSSARSNFTITEAAGLLLVAGGYNGSGPSLVNAEIYSPYYGTFTPTGALKAARSEHSALRLADGGVVVIGGGSAPAIERFDYHTGAWRTIGVLTDDRRGARIATSIPDGKILVIGGFPGPRRVAETFDPSLCSPVGSLSPASHSVSSGASDTYSFNVTLNHAPCLQTTASQAAWIGNIRISQGTGSGTVTYSVTANTTGAPRTGTITVAGATFTVTQAAASSGQSYCASSGTSSYEWIQSMTLAGVTQSTGNNGGYSDRTSSWTYGLTRSGLNSITLAPGFSSGSYNEYWRVWIDYNRDGVFSDSELVYGGSSTATINSGFSIPSSAPSGTTRMRISMKYGSSPLACGSFSYGEVEDYSVSIP